MLEAYGGVLAHCFFAIILLSTPCARVKSAARALFFLGGGVIFVVPGSVFRLISGNFAVADYFLGPSLILTARLCPNVLYCSSTTVFFSWEC